MENKTGSIVSELRDGALEITISNTSRYNALSMSMLEDLAGLVESANRDEAVRVVVLTGAGTRAFASGADISEFGGFRDDPSLMDRFNAAVLAATRALESCVHPALALIRGVCMGAGMSLAQFCDVRYCADDARFRMPAGRMGIGYEPEHVRRLVAVAGAGRAADLFFTARTFFGREAAAMGYVQECFSVEDYPARTAARVAAVASMAPLTLRAFKLALRAGADVAGTPQAQAAQAAFLECFHSADYQEGQRAFSERREPRFEGR